MARLAKDKKIVLENQLVFNFEENMIENFYKIKKQDKQEIKPSRFKKEFVAVKKQHQKRRLKNR